MVKWVLPAQNMKEFKEQQAWINEEGYREKGYRERKLAELEAKSKAKKTTVTKSMTEKDIMKTWDIEDGYTDEKWREECEQRRMNLRVKAESVVMMNKVNGPVAHLNAEQKRQVAEMLSQANQKQVGGDHYKNMGVEVWDVVDTWPIEQRIGAYRIGLLKYTMRMGSKDENVQEIQKAEHYAQKLIEVLKERDNGYEK